MADVIGGYLRILSARRIKYNIVFKNALLHTLILVHVIKMIQCHITCIIKRKLFKGLFDKEQYQQVVSTA